MLSAAGVGIPDRALSPYAHPREAMLARIVDQVAVCEALGDRVAWACILSPGVGLDAYKAVHGNRKGKGKRRR